MPYYHEEFKEQIIRKLMAPNAQSVAETDKTGQAYLTMYKKRVKPI